MKKIQLFLLPYAGGSASLFYPWESTLSKHIRMEPIELAGRGSRVDEALYGNLEEAIEDIYSIISKKIVGEYAVFGHSMGANLALPVCHELIDNNFPNPSNIFFSGIGPPHTRNKRKKYDLSDDTKLKDTLLELGGTPPELFIHPELIDFFKPILINDFKISEANSDYVGRSILINDVTIFLGKDDDILHNDALGWKQYTRGKFNMHYFNGDHFFIHKCRNEVIALINNYLVK